MERLLGRISPVLHLTRVTTAFAAISNVWFVILWSHSTPEEFRTDALETRPLWLLLLAGTASALGLYAFGSSLNDLLDVRRDRALRPDRPLPRGAMSVEAAAIVIAITLIIAVLGATLFGQRATVLALAIALCVLFFNAAARFVPGVGVVLLGLIYAGHMLVPNLGMRFLIPVWLVMSHALLVAAITHVLARKVPQISGRAAVLAVLGWLVWSVVILSLGWSRSVSGEAGEPVRSVWPSWVALSAGILPGILALSFLGLVVRRILQFGPGQRAADKVYRYGTLWITLYAAAWMIGAGRGQEAAILGGLAAVGFVTMTTLRELYGLAEQPVGYRR